MPATSCGATRCIVCGGLSATVVAESDDIRAEIEQLWAYHGRRLRPETPPERLRDRVAFSEPPPVRLVQCEVCGLVYRNPAERAREVATIYRDDAAPVPVLRSLRAAQGRASRAQAARVARMLGGGANGLEVGSYVGAFLGAAREAGLDFEGVDVNPAVNRFARLEGSVVHDGDLSAVPSGRRYDAVVIWNTFDQLADPRAALCAARRLVRAGAVLAIRVPSGSAYVRLRRASARGRVGRAFARAALAQNNLLGFPYRWGFAPESLTRLVELAGFRVEAIVGDVLVPVADAWTRRWARTEERVLKAMFRRFARRVPDRAPWFELYARRAD